MISENNKEYDITNNPFYLFETPHFKIEDMKPYEGKWVAVLNGDIICSCDSLQETKNKFEKLSVDGMPVYDRIPNNTESRIFVFDSEKFSDEVYYPESDLSSFDELRLELKDTQQQLQQLKSSEVFNQKTIKQLEDKLSIYTSDACHIIFSNELLIKADDCLKSSMFSKISNYTEFVTYCIHIIWVVFSEKTLNSPSDYVDMLGRELTEFESVILKSRNQYNGIINARFNGTCKVCGLVIKAGKHDIIRDEDGNWIHAGCSEKKEVQLRPAVISDIKSKLEKCLSQPVDCNTTILLSPYAITS